MESRRLLFVIGERAWPVCKRLESAVLLLLQYHVSHLWVARVDVDLYYSGTRRSTITGRFVINFFRFFTASFLVDVREMNEVVLYLRIIEFNGAATFKKFKTKRRSTSQRPMKDLSSVWVVESFSLQTAAAVASDSSNRLEGVARPRY